MKTAVSLPGEIFAQAERLARRLKKSRSKLYSDAIAEYIARRDPDLIVEKLDETWGRLGAPDDGFGVAVLRKTLKRND